ACDQKTTGVWRFRFDHSRDRLRPNDIPGKAALLERPDKVAGQIKLPPAQAVSGAPRLGMMIIMIAFAERAETDPEIILALIRGVEAAITEPRHVTDRVYRPGEIIDNKHRNV